MELRKYLFEKRITCSDFADLLGISKEYMRHINRGAAVPSIPLAQLIEIKTEGEVTVNDLRGKSPKRSRPDKKKAKK